MRRRCDAALRRPAHGPIEDDEGLYNAYLRFYEDGNVLSCLAGPSQAHEVARWLDKEHPNVSKGRWRWNKNGGELFFSTFWESFSTVTTPELRTWREENGVVNDCRCTLADDSLEVRGRSFWHREVWETLCNEYARFYAFFSTGLLSEAAG